MGTKWRGSAGSAGSKGYLIPIKSADLDAGPRPAVISGCLAKFVCSCAAARRAWRRALQSGTRHFSGSRRFTSERSSAEKFRAAFQMRAVMSRAILPRHIACCHAATDPTRSEPHCFHCILPCCVLSYGHGASQWHSTSMWRHTGLHLWLYELRCVYHMGSYRLVLLCIASYSIASCPVPFYHFASARFAPFGLAARPKPSSRVLLCCAIVPFAYPTRHRRPNNFPDVHSVIHLGGAAAPGSSLFHHDIPPPPPPSAEPINFTL